MITQLELTRYTELSSFEQHRNEAIERLLALGLSPLSVVPLQDADLYPKRKKGKLVIKDGEIQPLFNGKNPSEFDSNGTPDTIDHKKYQNRQPTQAELDGFFDDDRANLG